MRLKNTYLRKKISFGQEKQNRTLGSPLRWGPFTTNGYWGSKVTVIVGEVKQGT